MEKIILGLLMLRGMSIYEIKSTIDKKLNAMCSSSAGSIHTAIRQLLKKNLVGYSEEGKKKIYFITADGRATFLSWISEPMNHEKARNIEISKIFFMGMVEDIDANALVEKYIESLSEELSILNSIMTFSTADKNAVLSRSEDLIIHDRWNHEGLKQTLTSRSMEQAVEEIYYYQLEILQYAIDSILFEIDWYQKFLRRRKLALKINDMKG